MASERAMELARRAEKALSAARLTQEDRVNIIAWFIDVDHAGLAEAIFRGINQIIERPLQGDAECP